jgi:murein DD-endopeptidase MepM/ murein hydrolase activator NlpD
MNFHEVMTLPDDSPVYDLSGKLEGSYFSAWALGKYNEHRPNIYQTDLFKTESEAEVRCVHLGIDFFGPVGTPVYSFADGEVLNFGYNDAKGDYGHIFVLEVKISESLMIYALYGHLSKESIADKFDKKKVKKGEIIGWVGDKHENGGWPPHLHFQLSWEKPATHDMPGTCTLSDRQISLLKYPDPRLVLGPIYKDDSNVICKLSI